MPILQIYYTFLLQFFFFFEEQTEILKAGIHVIALTLTVRGSTLVVRIWRLQMSNYVL